mmetsp:Transcript_4111/g.12927  ORF Transcript_4111/g.12927 Transcript_4111/m.12927 type:complete len:310 (-) Transcript_4111:245-1174(-)
MMSARHAAVGRPTPRPAHNAWGSATKKQGLLAKRELGGGRGGLTTPSGLGRSGRRLAPVCRADARENDQSNSGGREGSNKGNRKRQNSSDAGLSRGRQEPAVIECSVSDWAASGEGKGEKKVGEAKGESPSKGQPVPVAWLLFTTIMVMMSFFAGFIANRLPGIDKVLIPALIGASKDGTKRVGQFMVEPWALRVEVLLVALLCLRAAMGGIIRLVRQVTGQAKWESSMVSWAVKQVYTPIEKLLWFSAGFQLINQAFMTIAVLQKIVPAALWARVGVPVQRIAVILCFSTVGRNIIRKCAQTLDRNPR